MACVDRDWRFVAGRREEMRVESEREAAETVSTPPGNRRSASSDTPSPRAGSRSASSEGRQMWRSGRWGKEARPRRPPMEPPPLHLLANPHVRNPVIPLKFSHLNEQKRYTELAQVVRQTVSLKEITAFLDAYTVDDLITAVPKSLSLMDAIYSKFYLCDRRSFPREMLKPEKLLSHLIWWVAEEESGNVTEEPEPGLKRPKRPETAYTLTLMTPHVRNLLRIIDAVAPLATLALHRDKEKLLAAIEGLGLHGLVNCGQNKLIEVTDAVRIELSAHLHQLKLCSHTLDKVIQRDPKVKEPMTLFLYSINGLGKAPAPTQSSHQRLMKLRVSDVRFRLARNRGTLKCLTDVLSSPDLESLARILEKRVVGDEELLEQFEALLRDPNPAFTIASANPVVAEVLVHFKKAYEALLSLVPTQGDARKRKDQGSFGRRDDSGFGEDDDSSNSDTTTAPQDAAAAAFARSKSGRLLGPVAALIEAKGKRFSVHRSLDFSTQDTLDDDFPLPPPLPGPLTPSRSLHNLHLIDKDGPGPEGRMWGYASGGESSGSGRSGERRSHHEALVIRRLETEVERLRVELRSAEDAASRAERRPSATPDSCSPRLADAVTRYNLLFGEARHPLMSVLDTLPELRGAHELQMKILFTVLVLAFRSISEHLEGKWKAVKEALGLTAASPAVHKATKALKASTYSVLELEAEAIGALNNAKEVSRQLWETLYDFPSLRSCAAFNSWVADCVEASWALLGHSAGAVSLAYEDSEFTPERHLRFHSSNLRSPAVRRCLWPALLLAKEKQSTVVLAKAVVLT